MGLAKYSLYLTPVILTDLSKNVLLLTSYWYQQVIGINNLLVLTSYWYLQILVLQSIVINNLHF